MNIYLVGYRCTGKTTVGRWLAGRLNWAFIDSDEEIVRAHGMTILHIVRAQGWEGFRKKETEALSRIGRLDRHVVATGGGAVLDPANVRKMKDTGKIFWLKASPETIGSRMALDEATGPLRPSLTAKGAGQEIEAVLAQRTSLYREAADSAIDTDGLNPEGVGKEILRLAQLESWNAGTPEGLKK